MKLEDLKSLPPLITSRLAWDARKPEIHNYIVECLRKFFAGDFGEIDSEDTQYNLNELAAGFGHCLARYKGRQDMQDDIYINGVFAAERPGLEDNHIMIMYCGDY